MEVKTLCHRWTQMKGDGVQGELRNVILSIENVQFVDFNTDAEKSENMP